MRRSSIGPATLSPLLMLLAVAIAAPAAGAQRPVEPHPSAATRAGSPAARDTLVTELLAADSAHASRAGAGLRAGFVSGLAADAVLLWPDQPVARGRTAAGEVLAALPAADRQAIRWTPSHADLSSDGTVGYSWGAGERVAPADSGPATLPFRYNAAWRRDSTGAWRVAAWALAPAGSRVDRDAWAAEAGRVPPACASAAAPVAAPIAAAGMVDARFELLGVDGDFATMSAADGTAPAFRHYMAPDGVLLGPAPTVACGPASLADAPAGEPGALTWTPRLAHVAASGDLGFTIGVATSRNGARISHSKYLTIWKRQPDGQWRFVADGGNDLPRR
ncbi:MAG: YybH family protein [Gemmatimonadaceae bacterium]